MWRRKHRDCACELCVDAREAAGVPSPDPHERTRDDEALPPRR